MLATYKYKGLATPRFAFGSFFQGGQGVFVFLSILLIIAYVASKNSNPITVFIGLIILFSILYSIFFSNGPGIVVSSKYVVFGNKVVMYESVVAISIDEKSLSFIIENQSGKRLKLLADNFTSNAQKSWKIKKNKTEKFIKVVSKITDHTLRENEQVVVTVFNANRFIKYNSTTKA